MITSIEDAARQLEAENALRKSEAKALLEALRDQFNADQTLQQNAIRSSVKLGADRITLLMRRGEENDADFKEFSVAISNEGHLIGPWNGVSNIGYGVDFVNEDAARFIQGLPFAVVKAFEIKAQGK